MPRSDEDARMLALEQAAVLKRWGVPPHPLAVLRGGVIVRTPAIEAIETMATPMLVLAGGVGVGKTIAAAKWFLDWVALEANWHFDPYSMNAPAFRGGSGMFVQAAQVVGWDRYSEAGRAAIDQVARVRRLAIDDLGMESLDQKGFAESRFDELIDARYAAGTSVGTVITTNLSTKSFALRYGARITDRLREAGRWFGAGSKSLRGRK